MSTEHPADSSARPSADKPSADAKIVELEPGPDGVFEPKRELAKRQKPPIHARAVRVKKRSEFDRAEKDSIEGFRKGMNIVRKLAKALDVDL